MTQHLILQISFSYEQSTFEKYNNNTFDIYLRQKNDENENTNKNLRQFKNDIHEIFLQ